MPPDAGRLFDSYDLEPAAAQTWRITARAYRKIAMDSREG
jgi:hypothetical protein